MTTIAASARAFVVLKQYLQETYYVDPSLLYGLDIANKSLQSLSFMLLVDAEKEIKEE